MFCPKPEWVPTDLAVKTLFMSRSRLYQLKQSSILKAGQHFIYASGSGSRILWSVPAIRQWQIEESRTPDASPETYSDLPGEGGAA